MTTVSPTIDEAYKLLCQQGRHFPESRRQVVDVRGGTYRTRRGTQSLRLDTFALRGTRQVYTNNASLRAVLQRAGKPMGPAGAAVAEITRARSNGLVWGFSGFATPGKDYIPEARGMRALFLCLRNLGRLPSLVCDGGVSDGVLGLSGVLAGRFGIPTLGYVPLEGLASIGPRTTLVVHKNTYREREILVGLTPDVLVCVGGGPGSQRECEKALENGGVVLLLGLREYDYELAVPKVYLQSETMRNALHDGRLIPCDNRGLIQERVPRIITMARRVSLPHRAERLDKVTAELAA